MPATLLLPVFVQVLLTFAVLALMGRARAQALTATLTDRDKRDLALGNYKWPEAATKAANNFSNQFEIPVLFYVGVAFALILKQNDTVLVGIAWAFVLSRIVHAFIHNGANVVRVRALAYTIGVFCVLAFWIVLMARVVSSTALI